MTSVPANRRGAAKAARTSSRGHDRAEQMARAAAYLFQEFGYQNVSIDRIGSAVGLTGPAVYRHFKGKHDILVRALMSQVHLVEELHGTAEEQGSTSREKLQILLGGLSDMTVNGNEATLWRREQRHLDEAEREVFRRHYRANHGRIAAHIAAISPAVGTHGAELLGFAVLSMYSNTPDIRGVLAADRLQEILNAAAWSIVECPLPTSHPEPVRAPVEVPRKAAGRRERIISAAARLFSERGFYDVRIDDIARASDMSTATLYQHMSSKNEVLRAVLERGSEGLMYVTADALAHTGTPRDALAVLIRVFVGQAVGVYGQVMAVLASDLLYLSEAEQSVLRETQEDYLAEWVDAISALSANLAPADARALAQAAIGVVTAASQDPALRQRPGFPEELTALAWAIALPPMLTGA